jgi:hypothetical protein
MTLPPETSKTTQWVSPPTLSTPNPFFTLNYRVMTIRFIVA